MDKILEALSKILPKEQTGEVATAVTAMLETAREELETEFNDKLEEAYAKLSEEKKKDEEVAYQGYEEAHQMISGLRNMLDNQKNEFEQFMKEQYEVAASKIKEEASKNETLEVELHTEYEQRLNEVKEFMITKVDEFLHEKGKEIYEQAYRDIVNDPRVVEHKLALDKVVNTVADYISDDQYSAASTKKVEEATKQIEQLKTHAKLLESKNIRLGRENTNLNEQVRRFDEILKENSNDDRKNRANKAGNVTGRGDIHTGDTRVIAENNVAPVNAAVIEDEDSQYDESVRANMLKLAGLDKKK